MQTRYGPKQKQQRQQLMSDISASSSGKPSDFVGADAKEAEPANQTLALHHRQQQQRHPRHHNPQALSPASSLASNYSGGRRETRQRVELDSISNGEAANIAVYVADVDEYGGAAGDDEGEHEEDSLTGATADEPRGGRAEIETGDSNSSSNSNSNSNSTLNPSSTPSPNSSSGRAAAAATAAAASKLPRVGKSLSKQSVWPLRSASELGHYEHLEQKRLIREQLITPPTPELSLPIGYKARQQLLLSSSQSQSESQVNNSNNSPSHHQSTDAIESSNRTQLNNTTNNSNSNNNQIRSRKGQRRRYYSESLLTFRTLSTNSLIFSYYARKYAREKFFFSFKDFQKMVS